MSSDLLTAGFPRLLADVGGTNVRFAIQAAPGAPLQGLSRHACADFPSLEDAIRHYLAAQGGPAPRQAAIGVACPVLGDEVRLTNNPWVFSTAALQAALGLERLLILNDFTALALALPALGAADRRQVGGGQAVAGAPVALIGPGTGLGVSGLLPVLGGGTALAALSGEGGQVSLAAQTREEFEVLQLLQRRFGHLTAERALSGPGLENLYLALAELRGQPARLQGAAQVSQAGLQGGDALAVDALALFCCLLGDVASNLALTLGARGGVYVGGGIVSRLGDWFDRSGFRARFETQGRFRDYLAAMPTYVIEASDLAALQGAAQALQT